MPSKLRVPQLVLHKPSGQSVVSLRQPDGRRKLIYLGPHGLPATEKRYHQVLAEHVAGLAVDTAAAKAPPPSTWATVAHVARRFLEFASTHYVDGNGKPSREVTNYATAFVPLLHVLRDRAVDTLSCSDLSEVRRYWIDTEFGHEKDADRNLIEGTGKRHSRRYVNDCLARCKSLFRWGAANDLVPGETWAKLSAFKGLGAGRGGARETAPVDAVPWPLVEATLPRLVPTIRDAVLVQWWSGMRPAELLALSRRQLDTSGPVWLYSPASHKGSWRGKERVVALGPKVQEILRPRLRLEADAPLFSGREAWNERRAAKRAARKCVETEQTRDRDRRGGRYAAGVSELLTVNEYRRHLHRAADKAGVPRWSPHRLRHAAGTRIAKADGIEAARAALGHSDTRMSRRYARGADVDLATAIAAKHA